MTSVPCEETPFLILRADRVGAAIPFRTGGRLLALFLEGAGGTAMITCGETLVEMALLIESRCFMVCFEVPRFAFGPKEGNYKVTCLLIYFNLYSWYFNETVPGNRVNEMQPYAAIISFRPD